MHEPFHTAIIGGGASGVLTAAQFHRQQPDLSVALIDSTGSWRGLAYGTPHDCHLLNVPAGNMSAFPDLPEHFFYWLRQRDPWAARTTFAPRKLYGDYLNHVLDEACRPSRVERITGTAVAVERRDGGWEVRLEDGRRVAAKSVVLALGNRPPGELPFAKHLSGRRYVADPWVAGALGEPSAISDRVPSGAPGATRHEEVLRGHQPVLLIGTGLTAIDVVLALKANGHTGPIHCISRRGLLPRAHAPCTPWTLSNEFLPSPVSRLPLKDSLAPGRASGSQGRSVGSHESPRALLKFLRAEIQRAEQAGTTWRAVIDAMRPYTARIWQSWPEAEKRRFLRHVRAHWEVHRHRAAPEIAAQIEKLISTGLLQIHKGRIVSMSEQEDGVVVRWRATHTSSSERGISHLPESESPVSPSALPPFRLVINCTGPECDFSRVAHPLIVQMREAGLIVPDRLRLSIETDLDGRVLDQAGAVIPGLHAVGPLRKARLWESTAMPEIRVQAAGVGGG